LPDRALAIHTAAPMALARVIRALLFAGVCLAMLAVVRPARAALAPLCDDRGASAVAPPPLLESPEDVLARAAATPCERDALSPLSTLRTSHAHDAPAPPDDAPALPVCGPRLPERAASNRPAPLDMPGHARSAMRSRVDRPPRA
jgi:hypothetical protein